MALGRINKRMKWLSGFPGGSDGKESACYAGDLGSIPELGRSPGEGNGNPLQHPCLENPMDREAWWATVQGLQRVRPNWATRHSAAQADDVFIIDHLFLGNKMPPS